MHIRHFATNSMIRLVGIQKVTPTINKKGKNQRKEGKVSFMGQHIRYNGFTRKQVAAEQIFVSLEQLVNKK